MSDWLLLNNSGSVALDLVTKVYQACCETEGLTKVMSLRERRQQSVKPASMDSALPQTQATIAITETVRTEHQSAAAVDISSVCENGCTSLPARETCPICEAGITVQSLEYGTCLNGHKWPRCFVSFCVCAELTHRRCQDCNRCVSTPSPESSPWLRDLLHTTSKCPFCFGFFH